QLQTLSNNHSKPVATSSQYGAEKTDTSRNTLIMRTVYPVPATSFPSTNSPSQTPVAPCHSWKSVTFTDWPSSAFHHSSVGNRVYRIVVWVCCTGAAGALSRVPA